MRVALPEKDLGLVEAAKSGDSAAFDALVRQNIDAVYGHALRFFGDRTKAEDAVQEVFIKVYRSLDKFDGRSAFSTWLFRLTRNTCLDIFRSERRVPVAMDPVSIPESGGGDFAQGVVTAEALDGALAKLPPEERDAFNAVALFGLDYAQAAVALEAPVGTVKSRVYRARRALIAMLGLTR